MTNRAHQSKLDPVAHPLLKIIILGGFATGLMLAAFGVILVYLGSSGKTEFTFFGQELKSTNVGIAAIFIGAVVIVLIVRRTLKSHDRNPT
jgi:uncharacterized membrane protein